MGIAAGSGGGLGLPAASDGAELSTVVRGFATRPFGSGSVQDEFQRQRRGRGHHFGRCSGSFLSPAPAKREAAMMYQLGWSTLPGLRGLSCSDFRATTTAAPDNESGVAVEFATETERDNFVRQLEEHFAAKRFTNTADAFDTVKAYVLEHVNGRDL